ncbi:MAG: PEP-CTERM sorting domain-containing protein [Candidatus Pacebacteria bacterium]|nr:PEP-CTERM sorting domain-containing protein [Candidatus Paceibacterota bacterium]
MAGSLSVEAETVSASLDADTYYYTQSYSTARTGTLNSGTFHVGMNILNTNPNYDGHFNFAGIEFSNLSGLTTAGSKFLQLNLKDFKTPKAIVPDYQGPPQYDYLATGSFRLAVVALGADFSESQTADPLSAWYQSNLFGRTRVAEVDLFAAGQFQIDVTSAVNDWIVNPTTNFGFGLIGVTSSPLATTARFYSMEAAENLGPVLIPEPAVGSLMAFGFAVALANRRRRRS